MTLSAIDLFAGPGGWDEGIKDLGISPLGIEWDDSACATREAGGHRTLRADVAELDPLNFAPCDLLIASPPCPSFSVAGKGGGMRDMEMISQCVRNLLLGIDVRHVMRPKMEDERALLVVEPLRFALALKPQWIALEQVPPVVGLWKLVARMLREIGYSTWAGLLSAEQYGVPQTRERAFLLASLHGLALPPEPTHQRYEFDLPSEEQHTLEGTLLPWVSMAEALGRWIQRERSGERSAEGFDSAEMPCQTLTSKARSWTVLRPATTIAGDSRVFQPGGHHQPGEQSLNAVRVNPEEAAILQGFRPDYPFQGSRTKVFEQIGNAVPPPVARAVIGALLS